MDTVKIIAGVLIVVVLVGGISLATGAWDPGWNPFSPSSEEVIEKMFDKQKETSSVHFEVNMKGETDEGSGELTLEGDSDNSDPENAKFSTEFELSFSTEGMEFSTAGEARGVEDTFYAKLSKIPAAPFLPVQNVDQYKDQWVKMESEEMDEMEQAPETDVDPQEVKKIIEDVDFKDMIKIEKEYADEKVKGVSSYHYLVSLNEKEVKETLPEVAEEIDELSDSPSEVDKEEMKEEIGNFFDEAAPVEAEIWIGKGDYLLRKVKFEKELEGENIEEETDLSSIDLSLELFLSDYGKSVNIEAPEDAKSLQELFMSAMMEGADTSGSPTMPEDTNIPEEYEDEIPEGAQMP